MAAKLYSRLFAGVYRHRPGAVGFATEAQEDIRRGLKSRRDTVAEAELCRLAAASDATPTKVPEGRRTVSEVQMHAVVHAPDDRRTRYPRAKHVEAKLGIRDRGDVARDSTELARDLESSRD